MFTEFDDFYKHRKVERTSATAYQSALYTHPLTPEHILGHRPNRPIKRGQIPWPQNRFHMFDNYYQAHTNNTLHAINDRIQCMLFGLSSSKGLIEMEPRRIELGAPRDYYDDDILGQTAAGLVIGMEFGALFSFWQTFNIARASGIYQSIGMPMNRWLPLRKATMGFKYRIWQTCFLQSCTFLGTFAFVDAVCGKIRGQDDWYNYMIAGVAAGYTLAGWFGKPFYSVSLGWLFGLHMVGYRFFFVPPGHPKPCIDLDSPFMGVGTFGMILTRRPPTPGSNWWSIFHKESRIFME